MAIGVVMFRLGVWIKTVGHLIQVFQPCFLEEQATNLARGQGFRSLDQVLSRFAANGNYQGTLDYFGLKGMYDPNIENPGEFDPSNGSISLNKVAFGTNYDYLRAVYAEELFHSQDHLHAKNNTPKDLFSHQYEEWRAQMHLCL